MDTPTLITAILGWQSKNKHYLTTRDTVLLEMAIGVIESVERKEHDQKWNEMLGDWKKSSDAKKEREKL